MREVPGFFRLATSDLKRRPLRTCLALLGVALSTALLLGTLSLHAGYVRALDSTIDRMGYQVLVTAKGCPYEAASLMMRGENVPMYIDEPIFDTILADPDVVEATRIFMQSKKAEEQLGTNVFMGVDDHYRRLKPWMTLQRGVWFSGEHAPEAILGYNAATTMGLDVGAAMPVGPVHAPLVIVGVFDRTGTQEDGMIFLPLRFSQELFDKKAKLTAVGVRLKTLDRLQGFMRRMFDLPQVQPVTMTQFRDTILEFVGTSRLLLLLSALVAAVIGSLGVLNAMTMSVAERMREFGVMKAVGASARNLFALTILETGCLGILGGLLGIGITAAAGVGIEALLRTYVPFAPPGRLVVLGPLHIAGCLSPPPSFWPSWPGSTRPCVPPACVRPRSSARRPETMETPVKPPILEARGVARTYFLTAEKVEGAAGRGRDPRARRAGGAGGGVGIGEDHTPESVGMSGSADRGHGPGPGNRGPGSLGAAIDGVPPQGHRVRLPGGLSHPHPHRPGERGSAPRFRPGPDPALRSVGGA